MEEEGIVNIWAECLRRGGKWRRAVNSWAECFISVRVWCVDSVSDRLDWVAMQEIYAKIIWSFTVERWSNSLTVERFVCFDYLLLAERFFFPHPPSRFPRPSLPPPPPPAWCSTYIRELFAFFFFLLWWHSITQICWISGNKWMFVDCRVFYNCRIVIPFFHGTDFSIIEGWRGFFGNSILLSWTNLYKMLRYIMFTWKVVNFGVCLLYSNLYFAQ